MVTFLWIPWFAIKTNGSRRNDGLLYFKVMYPSFYLESKMTRRQAEDSTYLYGEAQTTLSVLIVSKNTNPSLICCATFQSSSNRWGVARLLLALRVAPQFYRPALVATETGHRS